VCWARKEVGPTSRDGLAPVRNLPHGHVRPLWRPTARELIDTTEKIECYCGWRDRDHDKMAKYLLASWIRDVHPR
jgi:hypothetical protein